MEKIDNFISGLDVLKRADFQMAENDKIYCMGIIVQFNLTCGLAWEAIKTVLEQDTYNKDEIDELMILIRDSFIPAFDKMKHVLLAEQRKIEDDESRILSERQKNSK